MPDKPDRPDNHVFDAQQLTCFDRALVGGAAGLLESLLFENFLHL